MNQKELVRSISQKCEYSQKVINDILVLLMDTIKETVATEPVKLLNFGSFKTVKRKERTAFNPNSKASMIIPAKTVPIFKVAKRFKKNLKS